MILNKLKPIGRGIRIMSTYRNPVEEPPKVFVLSFVD